MLFEGLSRESASSVEAAPMIVVLYGVSGCGKTTVGRLLAPLLDRPDHPAAFLDADDLHPAANRDKLHRGEPLDDDDRWPWLAAVRAQIETARHDGRTLVVACSALKRAYRDALRVGPDVHFVLLCGSFDTIRERLAARRGHFMNPRLLQSQFDTLERPADEYCDEVSVTLPPDGAARHIAARLDREENPG